MMNEPLYVKTNIEIYISPCPENNDKVLTRVVLRRDVIR